MVNRTYSQTKRDKLDYRREYFKHNPGLFGCIWFCAYCRRPLIGQHNVQVDHIIPLNSIAGRNAGYNLVAACAKCNRAKSDTVDGRVVHGFISKIFDSVLFAIQKIIVVAFSAVYGVAAALFRTVKSALLSPITKGPFPVKVAAVIVYAAVAYAVVMYFRGR